MNKIFSLKVTIKKERKKYVIFFALLLYKKIKNKYLVNTGSTPVEP